MDTFTKDELDKAHTVIASLISKCEKAKVSLTGGHRTLLENRIQALEIASSLVSKALQA